MGRIGLSGQATCALTLFVSGVGICVWTEKKNWGVEPGIAISVILGLFLAVAMGDMVFTLMMIGSLLGILGVVYILIWKKAY